MIRIRKFTYQVAFGILAAIAALTVALAIGMSRMAKRNAINRKLIVVQALGSCTLICSDKAGNLTVNELTIRSVLLPDGRQLQRQITWMEQWKKGLSQPVSYSSISKIHFTSFSASSSLTSMRTPMSGISSLPQ